MKRPTRKRFAQVPRIFDCCLSRNGAVPISGSNGWFADKGAALESGLGALVEALDLKDLLGLDDTKLPHAAVDPKLMVALWLWATVEGVGSARHLEKRCAEHLVYRWLGGGIEVGHQALRDFRLIHGDALDSLIANGLAVLVEKGAIQLQLLSPEALKTQTLTGNSLVRKRRRLKALAIAAAGRVQKLRTMLDRDDPIADERYNRDTYWQGVQQQTERAKMAVAQMKSLSRPTKSRATEDTLSK